MGALALTRDGVQAFLEREFPQLQMGEAAFTVEDVGPMTAVVRMRTGERHIRPGGTLSGPAMMTLADVALFVAILANVGPVGLAVTTNLSFSFLRKPEPRDIVGRCRLLKLGRRLAVGEVSITSGGSDEPVCHAVGTYSIPPSRHAVP